MDFVEDGELFCDLDFNVDRFVFFYSDRDVFDFYWKWFVVILLLVLVKEIW